MTAKLSGKVATTVAQVGNMTAITYHNTTVVSFNTEKIVINSGGYLTNTTKKRINDTSTLFGLGVQIYQKSKKWFVTFNGETLPFVDGMTIQRNPTKDHYCFCGEIIEDYDASHPFCSVVCEDIFHY